MLTVSLKDKTAASLSSYISKPATSTCAMTKEQDENRNPNVPAAERMRQYRARMKEDPSKLSEMREKDRIRKAASRKKCTDLTASERQARREIERERKRRWRASKKAAKKNDEPSSQVHYALMLSTPFNTLRLKQNGHHFPDYIFKFIFLNENV